MIGLVLVEHDNKNLSPANYPTITAGFECCDKLDLLILGFESDEVINQAKKINNINKIIVINNSIFKNAVAEIISENSLDIIKNYDYLFSPANTFGKNSLPRIAAKLDVMVLSDITEIINNNTFVRPIYAGNAFETIESQEKIKILSIRTTGFEKCEVDGSNNTEVENINLETKSSPSMTWVKSELSQSERPELTSAKIVVSGGRALGSKENFDLINHLADKLGAAIGASRAAVDAGYVPNDYQVGQTGKVVAPELYIAIGISGAIQHLAGMKDSKIIVAINKDPDSPMMQMADYALQGDLFEIIPDLITEIDKINKN